MSEIVSQPQSLPRFNELTKYLITGSESILSPENVKSASQNLLKISNEIRTKGKSDASLADIVGITGVIAQATAAVLYVGANALHITDPSPLLYATFTNSVVLGCLTGSVYLMGEVPLDKVKVNFDLSSDIIPFVADKMRDTSNWLRSTLPENLK